MITPFFKWSTRTVKQKELTQCYIIAASESEEGHVLLSMNTNTSTLISTIIKHTEYTHRKTKLLDTLSMAPLELLSRLHIIHNNYMGSHIFFLHIIIWNFYLWRNSNIRFCTISFIYEGTAGTELKCAGMSILLPTVVSLLLSWGISTTGTVNSVHERNITHGRMSRWGIVMPGTAGTISNLPISMDR